MADANLTQAEADALIAMEKRRSDDTEWSYPDLGGHVTIPLASIDRRESFLLDLRRGGSTWARTLEVDYHIPKNEGGPNELEKRVLPCGPCNRTKGSTLTLTGLRNENQWMGFMAGL